MRIAVSGTHCVGKSTLIDEFLRLNPDFAHEPEPYTTLVEDFGEEFSAEPCVEDFRRQLEFSIQRLTMHAPGEKVIYERCPIDFLAYIGALEPHSLEPLPGTVSAVMDHLDLIAYLPIEQDDTFDAEFPKLRRAVDRRLRAILLDEDLGIVLPPVVEAGGSTTQRLHTIKRAMESQR